MPTPFHEFTHFPGNRYNEMFGRILTFLPNHKEYNLMKEGLSLELQRVQEAPLPQQCPAAADVVVAAAVEVHL